MRFAIARSPERVANFLVLALAYVVLAGVYFGSVLR